MKITTVPLENHQLRLTIEVDEERTKQAMQRASRLISKQVNIPGFRKGKAPYEVIVQRFGEEVIRQEATDMIVEDVYREALEQEDFVPYAPASLENIDADPLTFTFTVPLMPTVELGNYRDYRREPPTVTIRDAELEEALKEIRENNAILEPVERPAAPGDTVVFDISAQTANGEKFLEQFDVELTLDEEIPNNFPGLVEEIFGVKAGEEHTFTLPLKDDFPQEELRGQEAAFTVEMDEVYERTLPNLDDDLARTVGKYDSLDELKANIKESLRQEAQLKANQEYTTQILNDLLEQAQVRYPPEMLEEELDEVIDEFERTIKRETQLALNDYLRIKDMTVEELREELRPSAEDRLKRALVLGEVVHAEELEVDEDEISEEIEDISASWGTRASEIRSALQQPGEARDSLHSRLLAQKAIERLITIAKGEAPELPSTKGEEQQENEATKVQEGDSNDE